MHFLMMLFGLGLAIGLRCRWSDDRLGTWAERWQRALGLFLFPPLLLVTTAIAILRMGPSGQMVSCWEGWVSYGLAIGFLVISSILGVVLLWEGTQTVQRIRHNPAIEIQGSPARVLPTSELYSARVGFWKPELVVSQGLLDHLDEEHLKAVLVHEHAHAHYHDTFWFFWLGWLRRISFWLPNTEELWQELLMLREIRADQRATQEVDPLILAESLLMVVSAPIIQPELCAAFSWVTSRNRLMERIDSLLDDTNQPLQVNWWSLSWLTLVFLPLIVIPFHT